MSKASELTELTTTPATGDYFVLVDVSDTTHAASGTTKRLEVGTLTTLYSPVTIGVNGATEGGATFAALGSADWHFQPDRVTFEGQPDDVFYLGYNVTGAGAFQTPGLQAIYFGMEADYYSSPTTHYAEFYVECYLADQTTNLRPYSASINLDTGAAINQYKGQHIFYDSDGNQRMNIADNATDPINLTGGCYVRITTNAIPAISQLNAAGNAYIPIVQVTSSNRIFLGDTGYNLQTNGNLYFGINSVGPILIDRTTSTEYRLYVDSGVLGIEAV